MVVEAQKKEAEQKAELEGEKEMADENEKGKGGSSKGRQSKRQKIE